MIHARIKTLRILKHISQKDMAEMLHKSQSAYCRMENGGLQISSGDLIIIAKELDCKPEDLLDESGIINVLLDKQYAKNTAIKSNQQTPTEHDSKTMQMLLENQNKLIEEMTLFLNNQSEQNTKFMKEMIELVRKQPVQ
jgi:transcriptional regulator with XRE-family HTH domain